MPSRERSTRRVAHPTGATRQAGGPWPALQLHRRQRLGWSAERIRRPDTENLNNVAAADKSSLLLYKAALTPPYGSTLYVTFSKKGKPDWPFDNPVIR